MGPGTRVDGNRKSPSKPCRFQYLPQERLQNGVSDSVEFKYATLSSHLVQREVICFI